MGRQDQDEEALKTAFANALKRARGNRSQAEFARFLGLPSQQIYQRYESGLIPRVETVHKIAAKLGITIDQLLKGGKREDFAVVQTEIGELVLPWASDLEQVIQINKALQVFCSLMSAVQVIAALRLLTEDPRLNEKSKLFWGRILGAWAQTKLELEAFEKLSPKEKVAWRKAQNEAKIKAK